MLVKKTFILLFRKQISILFWIQMRKWMQTKNLEEKKHHLLLNVNEFKIKLIFFYTIKIKQI